MVQLPSGGAGGVLLSGTQIYFIKEIIRSFKLGGILSYRGTRHLIINAQCADNSGLASSYRKKGWAGLFRNSWVGERLRSKMINYFPDSIVVLAVRGARSEGGDAGRLLGWNRDVKAGFPSQSHLIVHSYCRAQSMRERVIHCSEASVLFVTSGMN